MAVRPSDWSPGEVLTASDLNDSLASKLPYSYGTATPSTTDSGFLWYDSNSTPPVPKYWDGSSFATLAPAPGLELVTAETFTSVSSVSVNGCFSSDYGNYRLLIKFTSLSGTNSHVTMRFRASGSDTTTNYLSERLSVAAASVAGQSNPQGTDEIMLTYGGPTVGNRTAVNVDIFAPEIAEPSTIIVNSLQNDDTNVGANLIAGMQRDNTSFDGFTLLAQTGNLSGRLRVYGYKD